MGRTYYQIELTARQLTVLLLLLGVAMVLAFVLGYAAAWSSGPGGGERPPVLAAVESPTPAEVVVPTPPVPERTPTEVPTTSEAPASGSTRPTQRPPTATPAPPTPTRVPPTATPAPVHGLWVQVLAVRDRKGVGEVERKLEKLGFPASHRRVVPVKTAGGGSLYKVRIGPFPDRESAHRVMQRMRASGFPDAWIVNE